MFSLKAKAEGKGLTREVAEREGGGVVVLYLWTLASETQDRSSQWVDLSPNEDMIWVVWEDSE